MSWTRTFILAGALALSACASGDKKKDPAPEAKVMSPDEILRDGGWGVLDDEDRLTFFDDGTYGWIRSTPCGKPPCPTTLVKGKWKVEHGKQL